MYSQRLRQRLAVRAGAYRLQKWRLFVRRSEKDSRSRSGTPADLRPFRLQRRGIAPIHPVKMVEQNKAVEWFGLAPE